MDNESVVRQWKLKNDVAKKRRRRRGIGLGWSQLGLQTAVLVATLLGCDFKEGALWLLSRRRHRRKCSPPVHVEVLTAALEETFLNMNLDELLALQDEATSPLNPVEFKKAVAHVNDRRLAGWVRSKNLDCGTVVRTATMAAKLSELAAIAAGGEMPLPPPVDDNAVKCWAYRWRQRNGAKISGLRKSEPTTRQEALNKAPPPLVCHTPTGPLASVPASGHGKRPSSRQRRPGSSTPFLAGGRSKKSWISTLLFFIVCC